MEKLTLEQYRFLRSQGYSDDDIRADGFELPAMQTLTPDQYRLLRSEGYSDDDIRADGFAVPEAAPLPRTRVEPTTEYGKLFGRTGPGVPLADQPAGPIISRLLEAAANKATFGLFGLDPETRQRVEEARASYPGLTKAAELAGELVGVGGPVGAGARVLRGAKPVAKTAFNILAPALGFGANAAATTDGTAGERLKAGAEAAGVVGGVGTALAALPGLGRLASRIAGFPTQGAIVRQNLKAIENVLARTGQTWDDVLKRSDELRAAGAKEVSLLDALGEAGPDILNRMRSVGDKAAGEAFLAGTKVLSAAEAGAETAPAAATALRKRLGVALQGLRLREPNPIKRALALHLGGGAGGAILGGAASGSEDWVPGVVAGGLAGTIGVSRLGAAQRKEAAALLRTLLRPVPGSAAAHASAANGIVGRIFGGQGATPPRRPQRGATRAQLRWRAERLGLPTEGLPAPPQGRPVEPSPDDIDLIALLQESLARGKRP
jgi:hypothetical protein